MTVNQIHAQMRAEIGRAKALTERGTSEGRGLTEAEGVAFQAHMAKVDELKVELNKAKAAEAEAAGIRSMVGAGNAWGDLAKSVIESGRGECRVKGLTETSMDAASTRIEPGITELPIDTRYIYG